MKRGKFAVAAVYVICPYCGESQEEPSSKSLMWEWTSSWLKSGSTIFCGHCGEMFTIPKWVSAGHG